MKFVVKQRDLLEKLSILSELKTNLNEDLLRCVVFEPTENSLKLYMSNLQSFLNLLVKLQSPQIDDEFKVAVNFKRLDRIIKALDDGDIEFEVLNTMIIIKQKGTKYRLTVRNDVERFPFIQPNTDSVIFAGIKGSMIKEMIDNVSFCASKEIAMRALNGAFWDIENGVFKMVASDGYRLALTDIKVSEDARAEFILSLEALKILKKFLNIAETYTVSFFDDTVVFSADTGDTAIFRKTQEIFPDYKKVLPKNFNAGFVVETHQLKEALRKIIVMESDFVNIKIGDKLVLITNDTQGSVKIEVPVLEKFGEIDLKFNPKFLMEGLKQFGSVVKMKFVDEFSPAQMTEDNKQLVYIVLPLRK